MDLRTPERLTPKQEALRDLDLARSLLGHHLHDAKEEWSPRALATRSFKQHTKAWLIGGTIAGLVVVKALLPGKSSPPKNKRDKNGASATNRGLAAMLLAPLLGILQTAALNYGRQYLNSYLQKQLSARTRPTPPPPGP